MLRGLEAVTRGMESALSFNDNIANNMANVNSTGYKQTKMIFKNIHDVAINNIDKTKTDDEGNKAVGSLSVGSTVDSVVIDFSQGGLKTTDNPLDMAINGDGFFSVQSKDGSTAYTRNGSFVLGDDGYLKTVSGEAVLGQRGPIKIDLKGSQIKDIVVDSQGDISVNNKVIDKLNIVDFKDKTQMTSLGESLFVSTNEQSNPPVKTNNFSVTQGALESSNANIIQSMVNSINASRTYETLNSMVQTISKSLEQGITQVGRVR